MFQSNYLDIYIIICHLISFLMFNGMKYSLKSCSSLEKTQKNTILLMVEEKSFRTILTPKHHKLLKHKTSSVMFSERSVFLNKKKFKYILLHLDNMICKTDASYLGFYIYELPSRFSVSVNRQQPSRVDVVLQPTRGLLLTL